MQELIVFQAYKLAEDRKRAILSARQQYLGKSNYGIAVDSDEYAVRWRKRNRQSKKFDRWLTRKLMGYYGLL